MRLSFPLLAAGLTAVTAAALVWALAPPPKRLSRRLQPYLSPVSTPKTATAGGSVARVFGPIVKAAAGFLGSILDRPGGEFTAVRLRQAGWTGGEPEDHLWEYRVAQLRSVVVGGSLGFVIGLVLGFSAFAVATLVGLGLVIGATRERGRIDKEIERRREVMRIEIYTINQLLAMRVRSGSGVVQAVTAIVARGRGEVVGELADALRLHRAGWSVGDAFRRIGELTPEPFCARTYRTLASAEERGSDLGPALLELSEDVRESRRESIKRSATKRRAAMLVPTIAFLAPVLLLFVAAPLPYLITGWN